MAISPEFPAADEAVSTSNGGRKQLQRIVRKVQHVLIITRCIDNLKRGASVGHWHEKGNETERIRSQKLTEDLKDLPILQTLPDHQAVSKDDASLNSTWVAQLATLEPVLKKQTLKQLLEAPRSRKGLHGLESLLDQYVADCSGIIRNVKKSVIKASHNVWISWAKRRGSSCRDQRSQALLIKLLEEGRKIHVLEGYLDAYYAYGFDRPQERLVDVISRLRAVFNVGWFFEWPSGRRPLNSTWPWADVKPSLLVLWGVCWMFYPPYGLQPQLQQQCCQQWGYQPPAQHFVPAWNGDGSLMRPVTNEVLQPLLPAFNLPASVQSAYRQPIMAPEGSLNASGQLVGFDPVSMGSRTSLRAASPLPLPLTSHSAAGAPDDAVAPLYLRDSWLQNVKSDILLDPNGDADDVFGYTFPRQPRSLDLGLARPPNFQPQAQGFINDLSNNHSAQPRSYRLPSSVTVMPSPIPFSYPPLDSIGSLHESRPYIAQERDYPQIPDHEYDQQQDGLPRYPSPPNAGLSDHPYNTVTQQLVDAAQNGAPDMTVDAKSESDAPSPGRSKPIPKPDREVTKLENGRFYCNWPNCTEDVKDFGRKCEWSKHMDKHDRPYKCQADGCEKLPGFTYSGGLLRHEREVHNKHGGPKKQLNCPHPNCKRNTGKGFSRQENLNEHMRRVHTEVVRNGDDTDEGFPSPPSFLKRKRPGHEDEELGQKEEMKRLKKENEDLRRQTEALTQQTQEMMRQLMQLQANQINAGMHTRMAPPAQMT